jgi:hypothetical protein
LDLRCSRSPAEQSDAVLKLGDPERSKSCIDNEISRGRFKARYHVYKLRIGAEACIKTVGICPDALKVMN